MDEKMPDQKTIFLLLGPKGSGKSYIGTQVEALYGIRFVRVEDVAQQVKRDRQINDESYLAEVFFKIEQHLRDVLSNHSSIIFESTGLSAPFDRMKKNLDRDFNLITIAIQADAETCLRRVKSRDQSIHINISDEQVLKINALVSEKALPCKYRLNNNASRKELVAQIRHLFGDKLGYNFAGTNETGL